MAPTTPSSCSANERAASVLTGFPHKDFSLTPQDVPAPWLADQTAPLQANDGVVILWGQRRGRPTLVVATDPHYHGGTLGDVGGARVAAAVRWVHQQATRQPSMRPHICLWLDGGGVRVSEGNAALLSADAVLQALCWARQVCALTAIVTDSRGCYGAWSIAAGLCHQRILVGACRLGLNGPKILQVSAPSADAARFRTRVIDAMQGAGARCQANLAGPWVADSWQPLFDAIDAAGDRSSPDPNGLPQSALPPLASTTNPWLQVDARKHANLSTGLAWLAALCERQPIMAHGSDGLYRSSTTFGQHAWILLALGPSQSNPAGAMGLHEARALTALLLDAAAKSERQRVLCIVDSPGQAMDGDQERIGLHQELARLLAAQQHFVAHGHTLVTLVVGQAISGGFLCFGLGAQVRVALGSPEVHIAPMGRAGMERLIALPKSEVQGPADEPLAYTADAASFLELGGLDAVLSTGSTDPDHAQCMQIVRRALTLHCTRALGRDYVEGGIPPAPGFGIRHWSRRAWDGLGAPYRPSQPDTHDTL